MWQKEGRFSKLGLVGHQFRSYIFGYSALAYVQCSVDAKHIQKSFTQLINELINQLIKLISQTIKQTII